MVYVVYGQNREIQKGKDSQVDNIFSAYFSP